MGSCCCHETQQTEIMRVLIEERQDMEQNFLEWRLNNKLTRLKRRASKKVNKPKRDLIGQGLFETISKYQMHTIQELTYDEQTNLLISLQQDYQQPPLHQSTASENESAGSPGHTNNLVEDNPQLNIESSNEETIINDAPS